ncbi:ATP-dependent helicase, partial [Cryobacterium sp. TMT2-15-1]
GRSGAGHTDAARSGASHSGEQAGSRPPRSRTRVSATTNPDAPVITPAAGTHDGGGAEHHDGNSAPRRRSRTRRHAPQAGTPS